MSSLSTTSDAAFDAENPDYNADYHPLADNDQPKKEPLPLDLVPHVAKRTLTKFSVETFRAVYETAISQGLTSEQEIKNLFGKDVQRTLKLNRDLSPATYRDILFFISKLEPKAATGTKNPWRHATPRIPEPAAA